MKVINKKNNLFLFIIGIGVFLFFNVPISASPTLFGPTGLIEIPTAEALQYKEFNFAIDYNISEDQENDQYFYKFNLGTFKGLELGVVGGTILEEGVYVNAKYYLMSDNSRFPLSIAIGFERLTSKQDTKVYLIASKKFRGGLNGHFGFNGDFKEETIDATLLFGVEYFLSNQFSILADISGENDLYKFNSGLRYYVSEFVSIRASVLDIGNNTGSGNFYSFGISLAKFL